MFQTQANIGTNFGALLTTTRFNHENLKLSMNVHPNNFFIWEFRREIENLQNKTINPR